MTNEHAKKLGRILQNEDAAQNALLKAIERGRDWTNLPLMVVIGRREAIDEHRRQQRHPTDSIDAVGADGAMTLHDHDLNPLEQLLAKEHESKAESLLALCHDGLSPRDQSVMRAMMSECGADSPIDRLYELVTRTAKGRRSTSAQIPQAAGISMDAWYQARRGIRRQLEKVRREYRNGN